MAMDLVIIYRGRLKNARKLFARRGWDELPERGERILEWIADHVWVAYPKNRKTSVRRWCLEFVPRLTDVELDQIVLETEERARNGRRWTHDQSAVVLGIGVDDREALHLWFHGANDDPDYKRRNERKRVKNAARAKKYRATHSTGRKRGRPALQLSPEEMEARKREQARKRQSRRRSRLSRKIRHAPIQINTP